MLSGIASAITLLAAAAAANVKVLLPTSQAMLMARHAAEGQGYDVFRSRAYTFDLITNAQGKPFLRGYVTFGFYKNGDTLNTISINERTGLTVDPVSCMIFDYPALRLDRRLLRFNGSPGDLIADLKSQSGCEDFKTMRRSARGGTRHPSASR